MPKTDRHWSLLLLRLISTQLSISALFLMTRNHFWFLTVTYCTWPRSKQRRLAMNLNVSYSAGTPLPGVWHWALASTCFYSRPVLRARITQMPSHPPLLLQPHTYMPSHSSSPTLCGYMGTTQTRGKYSSPTSNVCQSEANESLSILTPTQAKMSNICLFLLLKCDDSLFSFVIYDSNWRVFGCLTVCWIIKAIHGHYFGLWEKVNFKNSLSLFWTSR